MLGKQKRERGCGLRSSLEQCVHAIKSLYNLRTHIDVCGCRCKGETRELCYYILRGILLSPFSSVILFHGSAYDLFAIENGEEMDDPFA